MKRFIKFLKRNNYSANTIKTYTNILKNMQKNAWYTFAEKSTT